MDKHGVALMSLNLLHLGSRCLLVVWLFVILREEVIDSLLTTKNKENVSVSLLKTFNKLGIYGTGDPVPDKPKLVRICQKRRVGNVTHYQLDIAGHCKVLRLKQDQLQYRGYSNDRSVKGFL